MSGDFMNALSDAGSQIGTGLSNFFGQGGIGGQIGNILGATGVGDGSTPSPAATSDVTQTVDPTGSIGAQASIDAGQPPPSQTQTQNPQGQQGQDNSPVAQLTKALKAAQQRRQQQPTQGNPYQTGGGAPPAPQVAQGRAAPQANAISRPDAIGAGLYSPNIAPSDAVNAGLLDPSLIDPATGTINRNPSPPQAPSPPPPDPRAGPAGEAAVRGALAQPEATFTPPPQAPTLPAGGPSLGGLASMLPDALAAPGAAAGMYFGPGMGTAETGELPPDQQRSYPKGTDPGSYPGSTDYPQAQPGKPQLPSDKGQTPTKKQYEDWLKKMGVDPKKAKKAADDAPLPTKKPKEGERPPPVGNGNIMRDISGGQGVPMMLGQLAQMALPIMLMLGASGAFGGGRRHGGFGGRHGGFGGFRGGFDGHRGGFGGHPGFGGRPGFGERPGFGGFRPNRGFGGRDVIPGRRSSWLGYSPQDPIAGNPELAQLLQSLGVGGQNQNQQGGQGAPQGGDRGISRNPYEAGGGEGATPSNGPWSINPFLSNIVGSESGGRNISVVDSDGQMARGIYQFHDATWRAMAAKVPGASQYSRADLAPPEVQQAVALVTPFNQWGDRTRAAAHRQFGNFNENLTMGQLADQFGGTEWAGRDKTKTGGSTEPNPDGNKTVSPPNIKDPSEWPNNVAAQ